MCPHGDFWPQGIPRPGRQRGWRLVPKPRLLFCCYGEKIGRRSAFEGELIQIYWPGLFGRDIKVALRGCISGGEICHSSLKGSGGAPSMQLTLKSTCCCSSLAVLTTGRNLRLRSHALLFTIRSGIPVFDPHLSHQAAFWHLNSTERSFFSKDTLLMTQQCSRGRHPSHLGTISPGREDSTAGHRHHPPLGLYVSYFF